jgi:hypothetical protein
MHLLDVRGDRRNNADPCHFRNSDWEDLEILILGRPTDPVKNDMGRDCGSHGFGKCCIRRTGRIKLNVDFSLKANHGCRSGFSRDND